jgi:hypothetical protein
MNTCPVYRRGGGLSYGATYSGPIGVILDPGFDLSKYRDEGVEEVLVLAAQFDVLKAGAVAKGVVGDVEDVVGFVVGQVNDQEVELAVNGVDEAELSCQGMDGADAAVSDAADAAGGLIVNVGGSEHGSGTAAEAGGVETSLDAALAVVQPPS